MFCKNILLKIISTRR